MSPPDFVTVRFDRPINALQLAALTVNPDPQQALQAISIRDAFGNVYLPRRVGYDESTNEARFLLRPHFQLEGLTAALRLVSRVAAK